MARPNNSTLLLPFMAVLALIFPFAFGPKSSAPSVDAISQLVPGPAEHDHTNPSAEKEKKESDEHNAKAILTQFFGDTAIEPKNASESLIRARYQLDFLFVTIPDPVDSRLPYLFDRNLTAIQRAAETNHYVLASFDLPWLEEIRARAAAHASVTNSLGGSHDHHHQYETQPGYLLFRQEQTTPASSSVALLVFLVGETPTTGIQKRAMNSAFDEASWLCGNKIPDDILKEVPEELREEVSEVPPPSIPQADCDSFRILGPSFSGSAQSLDFVLHSWTQSRRPASRPHFRIVSGSATAVSACSDIFRFASDPDRVKDWHDAIDENEPIFSATTIRDKTTLNSMLQFIDDSHHELFEKPRVALLTEGNTAYGNSLRWSTPVRSETKPKSKRRKNESNNDAQMSYAPADNRNHPSCLEPPLPPIVPMVLPFPLHISRLRSEAERVRKQRESAQQEQQELKPSFSLPLPTEDDSGEAKDSVPSISQLDVSSSELMLSNLLATISREQFHYVGIAATDVRDVIFLAREIREHSPATLIFALNADLVYTHPEAYPDTRGMLIVTPYPLFVLNQSWMAPADGRDQSRLQFPDQASEGIYNAALYLMNRDSSLLEYASPFAPPYCCPYVLPDGNKQAVLGRSVPPLWIVTVGRDGFWPVAIYDLERKDASWSSYTLPAMPRALPAKRRTDPPKPSERSNRGIVPQFTHAVLILWGFLCVVPALMFLSRISENPPGKESAALPGDSGKRKTPRWKQRVIKFSSWAVDAFRLKDLFRFTSLDAKCFFLIGGTASLSVYTVTVTAYSISAIEMATPWRWAFLLVMVSILLLGFLACVQLFLDIRKLLSDQPGPPAANTDQVTTGWYVHLILGGVLLCWLCTAALIVTWLIQGRLYPGQGVITGFRSVNLFNGVSPLVPLLCLGLAAVLWVYCSLRRLTFLDETLPDQVASKTGRQCKSSYFFSNDDSFKGLQTLEGKLRILLACPTLLSTSHSRIAMATVILLALFWGGYLFFYRLVFAFEVRSFYYLLAVAFLLVVAGILSNVMRVFLLWRGMLAILRRLGQLPMRDAFTRFRNHNRTLPRMTLAAAPLSLTALGVSITAARDLLAAARDYSRLFPNEDPCAAVVKAAENFNAANTNYQKALECAASGQKDECCGEQASAQCELNDFTRKVEALLDKSWDLAPLDTVSTEKASQALDDATEKKRKQTHRALQQQAEEFLVSRMVHFLTHMFPQVTNLASYTMGCLFLMLMAISSYPLQPKNPFAYYCWFVIFGFVGVVVHMAVQMNRDAVLSCLNGTKPGEIHWDAGFIGRMVLLIVVPVLGLVGVQFPDTISQILRWIAPSGSGHP